MGYVAGFFFTGGCVFVVVGAFTGASLVSVLGAAVVAGAIIAVGSNGFDESASIFKGGALVFITGALRTGAFAGGATYLVYYDFWGLCCFSCTDFYY